MDLMIALYILGGVPSLVAAAGCLAGGADLEVHYHDVYLDQFDLSANATFKLRYLVDASCMNASSSLPTTIVLYTGNEGPITDFAANSGFLWSMAKRWNAAVVFIEERYFGTSLPLSGNPQRYLSSAQVLSDNVQVIAEALRPRFGRDARIVAVGGSYGGMLAAWLRREHPSLVFAALASSAPVLGFAAPATARPGGADPAQFWRTVERAFLATPEGEACAQTVRVAFDSIWRAKADAVGLATLTTTFALCEPLAPPTSPRRSSSSSGATVVDLIGFLQNWLQEIAVLNYPSGANFTGLRIPPHPAALTCSRILSALNETAPSAPFREAAALRAGLTWAIAQRDPQCTALSSFESYTPGLTKGAWSWQRCSDLIMAFEVASDARMLLPCASFAPNCWDTAALRSFGDFCAAAFGVAPPFGRMNMQAARLGGDGGVCGWSKNALSRVVFTNGALDPWSYGGVSAVNASSACAPPAAMIVIEGAAHHYDLRTPLATDPPAVVAAREEVITMITKWLDDDKDKDERWSPS